MSSTVSITIKTLQQKQFKVDADSTQTIAQLKEKILELHGHPVANQKLIYSGKILADDKIIGDCNIKEKDFLVLMVSKPKATPAASTSAAATSGPPPSEVPPAPVPAPAEPAIQPSPATTAAPDSAVPAIPAVEAPAFGDMGAFVTGSARETAIKNMEDMGFPRDQVLAALRASFNNPDRAVDYLMNGIPDHLLAEASGPAAGAQQPAPQQPAIPTAQQPQQSQQAPAAAAQPGNLFQAAQQAAQQQQQQAGAGARGGLGGGGRGPPIDIEALRNNPMFAQIQQMIAQNPALLQPLLQQLVQSNPQLGVLLNENPELLYQLLAPAPGAGGAGAGAGGGAEATALAGALGGEGDMGDDDEGGNLPPGAQVISVTQEEREAIQRLEDLGFPRQAAIEAYFACGKNEELAANFLLEGGFES